MKPDLVLMCRLYEPTQHVLESQYTVHHYFGEPSQKQAVIAKVADKAQAVATSGGRGMSATEMDLFPRLKIITCFGVGVDAIDLAAAKARGIAVTNTPDVLTDCVADLAMGLLLATVRRIALADRYVREGRWLKAAMPLTGKVTGARLGIVGLGRIGRAIAKRAEGFDLRVSYQGRNRQPDVPYAYYNDPAELAANVDFLIAACPGGEATRGIISEKVLTALGPNGVFVNIARGSVVDEPAMVRLLQQGKLGGAGLDVFADEPRVPEALLTLDNVVLQPHQASATHATRTAMGQLVIDNLAAFFSGKPLVTPV